MFFSGRRPGFWAHLWLVMCFQVFRVASAADSLLLDLRPEAVDAAGAVVGAVEMSVFDRQQYEYRYLESHHRNPKHPHCTPMWALRH